MPFFIYHVAQQNWLNWPCWLFTPTLSDDWAKLHWVANPSQRAMSQLLSLPGDYSIELLMQLHKVQQPLKHLFSCTAALFLCSLALFCPAYHLSPFLSKDIYQRNMAPPSSVTPTALCQLSEADSTDGCCWGSLQTTHLFVCIKITPLLTDSLGVSHIKHVHSEFPLEGLQHAYEWFREQPSSLPSPHMNDHPAHYSLSSCFLVIYLPKAEGSKALTPLSSSSPSILCIYRKDP